MPYRRQRRQIQRHDLDRNLRVPVESDVRHFDFIEDVKETGEGILKVSTCIDCHALHGAWSRL
jgi:hypothetical protein